MSEDEKKIYKEKTKDESESGSVSDFSQSQASSRKFSSQSSVIEKKKQAQLAEKEYIEKRMRSFHRKLSLELGKRSIDIWNNNWQTNQFFFSIISRFTYVSKRWLSEIHQLSIDFNVR